MDMQLITIEILRYGTAVWVTDEFKTLKKGDKYKITSPPENVDGIICTVHSDAYMNEDGTWGCMVSERWIPDGHPLANALNEAVAKGEKEFSVTVPKGNLSNVGMPLRWHRSRKGLRVVK